MPAKDDLIIRGRRRGDELTRSIGRELRDARIGCGLSQQAVARATGVPRATISRIETGHAPNVAVRRIAVLGAAVGLDLFVSLYPGGRHIRDVGQVRLLARLRSRLGPDWVWRFEVPLPRSGDQRAWDAEGCHRRTGYRLVVEAETRIHDLQALLRRVALKRRDGAPDRLLLLVADTRSNRQLLAPAMEVVRSSFPFSTRRAFAMLAMGELPSHDALVLI
jgi:transcriptional regulator with XRE-family HTH domain